MARVCRVVVVTEGWEDSAFLTGFLERAGVRNAECIKSPKGRGSGFTFVRETFANEVEALAKFSEGRGVLALMDEDGQGTDVRYSWVSSLLANRNLPAPDCASGRCLMLAKRNIETWVYWLTGARMNEKCQVDEVSNYKNAMPAGASRSLDGKDWRIAGRHLHSLDHTIPPAGMPPELAIALGKLRQFTHAVKL